MTDSTVQQTAFIVVRRKHCPSGRVIRKYRRFAGGWTEHRHYAWTTQDRAVAEAMVKALAPKWNCHVEEFFVNQKPVAKFGDPMEPLVLGRARRKK